MVLSIIVDCYREPIITTPYRKISLYARSHLIYYMTQLISTHTQPRVRKEIRPARKRSSSNSRVASERKVRRKAAAAITHLYTRTQPPSIFRTH